MYFCRMKEFKEMGDKCAHALNPQAAMLFYAYSTLPPPRCQGDAGAPLAAARSFTHFDNRCSFMVNSTSLTRRIMLEVVDNHLGPSNLGMRQFDGWSENDKIGIFLQ